MNVRRRSLLVLLLAALAGGPAWSQAAGAAQAPPALKETRSYYQDVAGYHAQGKAEAADRAEAQRLAKAAALNRLFKEIGKDSIFGEMCISGWPEYISVEDSVTAQRDGTYLVLVQVVVATSAIMLTEQKYQVTVVDLLGSTELSMAEVEKDLVEADTLERNVKVPDALGAYRRARSRAAEARELVRDVGDKSVLSEGGNNITAITTKLDALSLRIAGGLERMEAIERETEKNAAADEMSKAYDLYEAELGAMEGRGEQLSVFSPFYDLPRTRLDAILLDLQADRAKNTHVTAELERLRAALPEDRQYLRQKVELSLTDARALARRLERMETEVRQEIKTPRLVRQERAQRARALLAAVGRGARYAFLHKPTDTVSIIWELPLRWDMENPVHGTGEADVLLEAEGAFPGGLWIRGAIGHDDVTDSSGAETWRNSAWSSGLDLGVGKRVVLGFGVAWDWAREVGEAEGGGASAEAERELGLRLHLGGVDSERRRLTWLLSLGYAIPTARAGELVVPYHLNVSVKLAAKVADILVLRAALRTKSYQSAAFDDGVEFTDAFSYRFDWSAGIGLRLPPPFVLGVSYGGQITAGMSPQGLTGADAHVGGWSVSLGYVF